MKDVGLLPTFGTKNWYTLDAVTI